MDVFVIIDSVISFFQENLLIAIPAGIICVYLLFRKPKTFFTLLFVILVLAGMLYVISGVSSTGVQYKKTMIQKVE